MPCIRKIKISIRLSSLQTGKGWMTLSLFQPNVSSRTVQGLKCFDLIILSQQVKFRGESILFPLSLSMH